MLVQREYKTYKGYSIISCKKHQDAKVWRAIIQDRNGKYVKMTKAYSRKMVIRSAEYLIDKLTEWEKLEQKAAQ